MGDDEGVHLALESELGQQRLSAAATFMSGSGGEADISGSYLEIDPLHVRYRLSYTPSL